MVARIVPGRSLKEAFYYNENKLKDGVANCLLAENYPLELVDLDEISKLKMLQKMAALNPRVQVNSVHISLNFDPSEKITPALYVQIARKYMDGIGFGNQPYLVYEHQDSGHPHIHILTTNVQSDGRPISLHHLGRKKSEPTRKLIEEEFGLVRAEGSSSTLPYKLESAYVGKIEYGRSASKKAIALVLGHIVEKYRYQTLEQLNAALGIYNVQAYRGSPGTRVYDNGGLLYRILDDNGKPVGAPIKASAFHSRPTLKRLEKNFAVNAARPAPYKEMVRNTIDRYFMANTSPTLPGMVIALKKQGIDVVVRRSAEGMAYGITYIDHGQRCVINGSDIGKAYAAKGINQRCIPQVGTIEKQISPQAREHSTAQENGQNNTSQRPSPATTGQQQQGIVDILLRHEEVPNQMPYELTGKEKKKRRKKKS